MLCRRAVCKFSACCVRLQDSGHFATGTQYAKLQQALAMLAKHMPGVVMGGLKTWRDRAMKAAQDSSTRGASSPSDLVANRKVLAVRTLLLHSQKRLAIRSQRNSRVDGHREHVCVMQIGYAWHRAGMAAYRAMHGQHGLKTGMPALACVEPATGKLAHSIVNPRSRVEG